MSGNAKSRATAKPRATGEARAARPRGKKAAGRWAALGPATRRWIFIGGFCFTLLVGLPLAHALVGEVGAILLGTFAFGFVVGRMTQKR
jgi:hypothetical protein